MAKHRANTDDGAPLRTVFANRQAIGLELKLLGVVAVLAVVAGFGQAATLLIVVRAATALTADTELISGDVGPFTATDLTINELIVLGFAVLAVLLIAEVAMAYAQATLQSRAMRSARRRILRAFARSTYDEQIALARGDIQTVISSHTASASSVCAQIAMGLVAALNFLVLLGSAVILSPQAAAMVLGGVVAVLVVLRPLLLVTRRAAARRVAANRELGRALIQRLELSREIRAFGVDQEATSTLIRFVERVASTYKRQRFLGRLSNVFYRVGTFAIVLVMLAFIDASGARNLAALAGALLMLLRSMSYGQSAQTFYQAINETVPEVVQLAGETDRLENSAAAQRAADIEPDKIGKLRFEAVRFAYADGDDVLHGVNFDIEPGDFTAIVGPSGSGKSTIMSLLLRLFRPDGGAIICDGVDSCDISPDWWHRRVAYVPQESKLQDGSITDTIRFYRDWITDEDICRAAALAHIAEEVESWPDGYDTEVGQLGDQVSGGQRQRLAIARALAGNPELLLLDEPTSALDPESEELISETLDALRGKMTIVVIAHRFKTVERANRVVHVRDGRIVPSQEGDREQIRRLLGA